LISPDKKIAEPAFTASLVQDIGILLLAMKAPDRVARCTALAASNGTSWHVAEVELGAPSHAQVGAYLLGAWGLPFEIVEAVAYHHRPGSVPDSCSNELLSVVHASAALVDGVLAGHPDPARGIDTEFASRAGFLAKLPEWRALVEGDLRRCGATSNADGH
jgi:HD-like signal output (HDOD) protein